MIQEFKNLLEKYQTTQISAKEKQAVDTFFDEMQREGVSVEDIEKDRALQNRMRLAIQKQTSKKANRKKTSTFISIAAAFFAIVSITAIYFTINDTTEADYIEVATLKNEMKRIWLADSSLVVLNENSKIRYKAAFSSNKRAVQLFGQAYFEVKPNPTKPFIVITDSLQTEVLGTRFSVTNIRNQIPEVIVVSGKVKVSNKENQNVFLTKNQRVQLVSATLKQSVIDENFKGFWQTNTIYFNKATLLEVVLKLEKQFNVTIVLDKSLQKTNTTMSGRFSAENIHEALEGIRFIYNINYTIKNERIIEIKP